MNRPLHLIIISIFIFSLFFSGLILYLYAVNLIMDQIQEQGIRDIYQIYSELLKSAPNTNYQLVVRSQKQMIPAHIVIVTEDFTLLADSHNTTGNISGRYITADLSEAKQFPFAVKTVRSRNKKGLIISLSQLKKVSSKNIIIQLTFQEKRISSLTTAFLIYGISVLILLTGLVYFLVLFSIKRYQKPIHSLIHNTKIAAGGVFSKITVDTGSSEIMQIVENFNALVDRYNLVIELDNKKYSRINTLLSNMKAGIVMVDTHNIITLVNPQAERLLDLNKVKLFKNRDDSIYREGIISEILLLTKIVNKENIQKNITLHTGKGIILDISIQTIFNKYFPYEHNGALVFLQDVTEMRKLEKLKDEFISNVSHEFRTPLTVISGFVETIKSWEILNTEDRNTAINIIEVETERLKKLISELMTLSHIEGNMGTNSMNFFDPVAIVKEVAAALEPFCSRKKHIFNLSIQEGITPLFGMGSWFRQILFNLYDNAIKYTPEGGLVGISMKSNTEKIYIEVTDSGAGIPDNERENIFERFYRLNKSRSGRIPGNGLGLSITRQMVEEFGGSIEVVNNVPEGSLFKVIIPYKKSKEPAL